MNFFPTWLLFLISRVFQPLLTILIWIYHLWVSNSFPFMCILVYHDEIWKCKLVPSKMHVQIHSKWTQHGFALIIGPHMRLYRPMHIQFQMPCTRGKHDAQPISAINKHSLSFIHQPFGDLKCCSTEIPTITKGIFIFFSLFQAWNSTSLVDFQSSIP